MVHERDMCPLEYIAQRRPDADAIVGSHQTLTYQQYHTLAHNAALRFQHTGLGEGGVLGIALPPGPLYPPLLLGALRSGLVPCPLNTRFPIQYILDTLRRIGCRTLMTPYGPSATTVRGRLYALAPRDIIGGLDVLSGPSPVSSAHQPWRIPLDRPAAIVLTSGSSGPPKAALHSFGSLWASATLANANMPLAPGDRWLLSLPLYHVAGLGVLMRCLAGGAAVVMPAANEGLGEAIAKYRVTHISLVATQLYRLMREPAALRSLSRLKAILLGGSAIPEPLIRRAVEEGLPIHTSYGLTETAAQITATPPDASLEMLLRSGLPLAPDTVRISGDGLIEVGGPSRFMGYITEQGLDKPFTGDDWFTTGDRGALDPEAGLRVLGRSDNMFISGGENVQPEEIEEALSRQDQVRRAVVVPAPHPEFVHCAVAFIDTPPELEFDSASLEAQLRAWLPAYKIPKAFYPWPHDLANSDEKIKRMAFMERAAELYR